MFYLVVSPYKPKLVEIALQVSDSPRIHYEASKDPSLVSFATCTLPLVVEGVLGASITSFPGLLHLQFLTVYSMQKYCKRSKTGGVGGLGMRLCMQLQQTNMLGISG